MQEKWKYLRGQFGKEAKKKPSGDSAKKRWAYFEDLTFLRGNCLDDERLLTKKIGKNVCNGIFSRSSNSNKVIDISEENEFEDESLISDSTYNDENQSRTPAKKRKIDPFEKLLMQV